MEDFGNQPPWRQSSDDDNDVCNIPVFVYGSLLSNLGNHRVISDGIRIAGEYTTSKHYKMISLGGFPGVLRRQKPSQFEHASEQIRRHSIYRPIKGELYKVNKKILRGLDALEGNGSFYTRYRVPINKFTGKTAWMYILNNSRGYYDTYALASTNENRIYDWKLTLLEKRLKIRKG